MAAPDGSLAQQDRLQSQHGRGLFYLVASYGLQQYDGAQWRYLPAAHETTSWAIARDRAGTLYVGGGTSWSTTARLAGTAHVSVPAGARPSLAPPSASSAP